MHLTLTFATLLAVTAILVLLRLRWTHLSPNLRRTILATACAICIIFLLSYGTGWSTTGVRLNYIFYWLFLASVEFFVLLITLVPPRWLTSLIAVVLLLPILSASIFLPLTAVFAAPPVTTPIGDHLVSTATPWNSGKIGITGIDLDVYYRPAMMPFLQRRLKANHLYNTQCDTGKAFVVIQPDQRSILLVCPVNSGQAADHLIHTIVPLY